MLKGINPLLTPELLKTLAEMGHGDEIVVADANFTGTTLSKDKVLIHMPGADIEAVCAAILSLFPLDSYVAQPIAYMHVCDQPAAYRSGLQRRVIARFEREGWAQAEQCEAIERFAFYDRVKKAHAVVMTGDLQPYGNFILKKGVIGDPLEP